MDCLLGQYRELLLNGDKQLISTETVSEAGPHQRACRRRSESGGGLEGTKKGSMQQPSRRASRCTTSGDALMGWRHRLAAKGTLEPNLAGVRRLTEPSGRSRVIAMYFSMR